MPTEKTPTFPPWQNRHERVDAALAFYWSAPELAPLRKELKDLVRLLYPRTPPTDWDSDDCDSDNRNWWALWNSFHGMLTSPEFVLDNYWDCPIGHRIRD